MSSRGPDFLCIGMQKSGTGWIYDALSAAPGFQMMPVKEFHHFDMAAKGHSGADDHRKRLQRAARNRAEKLPSPTQFERFNAGLETYIQSPTDENYLQLFESKSGLVTGDLTPAYSTLSRGTVEHVRNVLPHAKIILSVREPRSRAWSHFNMYLRRQMTNQGIATRKAQREKIDDFATLDRLSNFVRSANFLDRSFPYQIYETWKEHFAELLVVDFQQIVKEPAAAFGRVSSFLGGEPTPTPTVKNRKAKDPKATMTPAHRQLLEDVFADEIVRFAAAFPAIGGAWR